MADDLIELLLGIAPDDRLGALRRQRPEALRHAEGAFRQLLLPAEPGGLSLAERAAVALCIAARGRCEPLRLVFRALLERAGAGHLAPRAEAAEVTGEDRLGVLLRYAETAGLRPREVTGADTEALAALGLGARDIVALTQLVAFVPFQMRLVAGLRAMQQEQAQQ